MNAFEIVGGILLILSGILIIALVMSQQGRQMGMNAINGSSSESYFGKNRGRTLDAILERWTKVAAIVFFILTVVVNVVAVVVK